MKKRLLISALGLALIGFFAMLWLLLSPMSLRAPWAGGFNYVYPSFATQDDQGAVYTIDRSLCRITKVDPNGKLRYEIKGGKREQGNFFYAAELAVDQAGRLFVLNTVLLPEGFATGREEILMYDAAGRFVRTIYSKTYRPEEITNHNATRGRWLELGLSDREVTWFELTDDGVVESRLDLETWKLRQEQALSIPYSAAAIASVVRWDADRLAYVTKTGEVWVKRGDEKPALLYSGDEAPGRELSVPWWVGVIDAEHLVFTDLTRAKFIQLSASGVTKDFITSDQIKGYTGDQYPYVYYGFSRSRGGRLSTVNDMGVLTFSKEGKIERSILGARYPTNMLLAQWLFWIGVLLETATVVAGAYWVRVFLTKKRTNLALNQLVVILPIMIMIMGGFTWALIDYLSKKVESRTLDQLSQMVQVLAQVLDTDALARVKLQRDFDSPAYRTVRESLHKALNYNRDPWNSHLYFALHRIHEGKIYTMMYLNDGVGTFQPYTYLNDPQGIYWKTVRTGISTLGTQDAWGSWLLAVGPVKDKEGRTVALIEVGRDMYGYSREMMRDLQSLIPLAVTGFSILILAFVLFTWVFLSPLRSLKNGVKSMTEGQWDTQMKIVGHDEVSELTVAFNRMTIYIRDYIREIVTLSQGYRRFVPQQFLTNLNKKDVTEVSLGDQIQREMTVLFSDIRSFTQISERMSPKENFDFLNQYLGLVGPEVRKNNGFIDKYIGDAIMALYPESADDALQTAICINLRLAQFNDDQTREGRQPIKVGIGIHTGMLMLGILGEPERFDGSVISDNVNLASRIEGLTKTFDATILTSEATMGRIANPDRYLSRYLGKVQVIGKAKPIGIYEILDDLPDAVKTAKIAAKRHIEAGIAAYQAANFPIAEEHFNRALQEHPGDAPARIYLSRLKELQGHAIDETWNSAIVMDKK